MFAALYTAMGIVWYAPFHFSGNHWKTLEEISGRNL